VKDFAKERGKQKWESTMMMVRGKDWPKPKANLVEKRTRTVQPSLKGTGRMTGRGKKGKGTARVAS
jgi:hypothetical protein